jgi:hypothetical protein
MHADVKHVKHAKFCNHVILRCATKSTYFPTGFSHLIGTRHGSKSDMLINDVFTRLRVVHVATAATKLRYATKSIPGFAGFQSSILS